MHLYKCAMCTVNFDMIIMHYLSKIVLAKTTWLDVNKIIKQNINDLLKNVLLHKYFNVSFYYKPIWIRYSSILLALYLTGSYCSGIMVAVIGLCKRFLDLTVVKSVSFQRSVMNIFAESKNIHNSISFCISGKYFLIFLQWRFFFCLVNYMKFLALYIPPDALGSMFSPDVFWT